MFCETACRTGGGGIPDQFTELFGINLSKSFSQLQCEDIITGPLEQMWNERKLETEENIAWLFIYPKIGTLTHFERNIPLSYVLSYDVVAQEGTTFHSVKSCADAVSTFILSGRNEKEVEERIFKALEWWESTARFSKIEK